MPCHGEAGPDTGHRYPALFESVREAGQPARTDDPELAEGGDRETQPDCDPSDQNRDVEQCRVRAMRRRSVVHLRLLFRFAGFQHSADGPFESLWRLRRRAIPPILPAQRLPEPGGLPGIPRMGSRERSR